MNVRILVVDDEVEIREMLSRHFRFLGYQVDTAANGKEALEQLEKERTDVVITDLMMPVMDGIELLKAVRTEHPMVRTIVITGYVTLDNALACLRHGADTFIFKPLEDLAELEQAVARAVKTVQRWFDLLRDLRKMKPSCEAESLF